jgi:hypothetical protein
MRSPAPLASPTTSAPPAALRGALAPPANDVAVVEGRPDVHRDPAADHHPHERAIEAAGRKPFVHAGAREPPQQLGLQLGRHLRRTAECLAQSLRTQPRGEAGAPKLPMTEKVLTPNASGQSMAV